MEHTSKLAPTTTVTGRIVKHDPQIQNLPVRTEEGQKIIKAFQNRMPMPECDFSAIDSRSMAMQSQYV